MDHDEAVRQAIEIVKATDESTVVAAWLGSLSSRDLAARAAFGSYVVLQHLSEHAYIPSRYGGRQCGVCGLRDRDVTLWTEEKLAERKYLYYSTIIDFALPVLTGFPGRAGTSPTEDDHDRLRRLLDAVRALPATARLVDLSGVGQGIIPSNKRERICLMETLGCAGILCPANLPHYTDEFVPCDVADTTYPAGVPKSDWAYPARCWTGANGVNEAMVTRYFALGG